MRFVVDVGSLAALAGATGRGIPAARIVTTSKNKTCVEEGRI